MHRKLSQAINRVFTYYSPTTVTPMPPNKLQKLVTQKRERACYHAQAWTPCVQKR